MSQWNSHFVLLLLIICWTLNPFVKKTIAKKIPIREYIIYNQCICSIIVIIYSIYLYRNNIYDTSFINNLTMNDLLISSIGAIITVSASLLLVKLLRDNDASTIIPQIQPCIILLTLIIGYFIFNEKITKNKITGTILIILGLIFINK